MNTAPHPPVKLAIVDDDAGYRASLRELLGGQGDIVLYREYDCGHDFIRDIGSPFRPDVCLIDVVLKDMSGVECAKRLRAKRPEARIIIMTAYPEIESFNEARSIGADYIEKNSRSEALLKKIILSTLPDHRKSIFSIDSSLLSEKSVGLMRELREVRRRYETLSPAQARILGMKRSGMSVDEIAAAMGVHRGTIATQLSRAYEKLNLPDLMDFIDGD
ncbi:MAG: response regulator [Spirochaetota bacterium]